MLSFKVCCSPQFGYPGNVPTKNKVNKALGRWVSTQRSNYKKYRQGKGNLRPKTDSVEMERRIRMLNGIGFNWSLLPGHSSGSDEHSDETDEVEDQDEDDDQDEHQGCDMDHQKDDDDDDDYQDNNLFITRSEAV
jgi:hypothetical protein